MASKVFMSLLISGVLLVSQTAALDQPLLYEIVEEERPRTFIANIKSDARLSRKYSDDQMQMLTFDFLTPAVESDMFILEEYSGILETAEVIDRDELCPNSETCIVNLDIAVQPNQFFEVIKVSIEILDKNDNAPRFPQTHISRSIAETTTPGILFPLQPATDPDSPENGVIQYDLISSTSKFRLEKTLTQDLTLYLNEYLNREEQDFYQLKVVASDGGLPPKTGTVTIDITVNDVNDNNPQFDQPVYNLELVENIPADTTVLRVHATDPDAGANGIIVYSFDSRTLHNFGDLFHINNVNGEISTKRILDHEEHSTVSLLVQAKDQGVGSVPAMVKVNFQVMDVNDNAPEITVTVTEVSESGTVLVEENIDLETFIAHINVVDPDGGQDGKVQCTINDDSFRLNKLYDTDYTITTASEIDREQQNFYYVVLTCHDLGEIRRTSSTNITMEIVDENDNEPSFEQSLYNVSMNENNPPQTVVVQVKASDPDSGQNGNIVYTLHKDAGSAFNIDPKSGAITTQITFDREHISYMEFHAIATDKGDPPSSSETLVALTINDLNDEPPKFTQAKYIFTIAENNEKKSEVGKVVANDKDLGPNNDFSFYLEAENSDTKKFSIDPITGAIFTKKTLNREAKEVYKLRVLVQSESLPHMSDTAEVTVYVSDKNDNSPFIVFPSGEDDNTLYITNDLPIGTVVGNVTATDADFGPNKDLTFMISKGNDNEEFVIEPKSGKIIVHSDLSQHEGKLFQLVIMVKDSGEPTKISVTNVYIRVEKGSGITGGLSNKIGKGIKLSSTHLAIIIGVIAGCVLIATILIIAIVCVRKRSKNLQHKELYWPKVPPGDAQSSSDEQKTVANGPSHKSSPVTMHGFPSPESNPSKKLPDYSDVSIGLKAEYLNIHQASLHPPNKDKDTDSGCADVSHSESQGSNEDGEGSQRSSKTSDNGGVTTVPVVVKTFNPGHTRTAPRRMESFSDWVHSENYHLQQKGNMYRVQDPSVGTSRKSVRFTEPAKANQNDYTVEPSSTAQRPPGGGSYSNSLPRTDGAKKMDLTYPASIDPYDNAGSLV